MKHSTVISLGAVTLLAALVPAEKFFVIDAGSSGSKAYLFENKLPLGEPVKGGLQRPGGENGLHVVFKSDKSFNVGYFTELLIQEQFKLESQESANVYILGTGGVRDLADKKPEQEKELWQEVKNTFLLPELSSKFKLLEQKTLSGKEEAEFGYQVAVWLTGDDKAGFLEVGGKSIQVGNGIVPTVSFQGMGSVSMSEKLMKNLWENPAEYSDYKSKTDALEKEIKDAQDAVDEKDKKKKDAMKKKIEQEIVSKAISEGGVLEMYRQKIEHPCLMQESDPMDVIKGFNTFKSAKVTLADVVPFVGKGDYQKCFNTIADLLTKDLNDLKDQENKHVPNIPAYSSTPVVVTGSLYHSVENLKKIGIWNKDETMNTVGHFVKAAKAMCGKTYNQLEAKEIKPHNLIELCWATTYGAAWLKHVLKLDDEQTIMFTSNGWVYGKAFKIIKDLQELIKLSKRRRL